MNRKKPKFFRKIIITLVLCLLILPSLVLTIYRGGLISLQSTSASYLNTTYHMNLQNIKDTQIKKYFDAFYFLTNFRHATYYEVFHPLEDAHLQLYIDRYANRASYEVVDAIEIDTKDGRITLEKCTVMSNSTANDRPMFLSFTFDADAAFFSGMLMPRKEDVHAQLTTKDIEYAKEVILNTCIAL